MKKLENVKKYINQEIDCLINTYGLHDKDGNFNVSIAARIDELAKIKRLLNNE